jgi:SAM-dependent methyltransferase
MLVRTGRGLRLAASAGLVGAALWHAADAAELRRRVRALTPLPSPPAGVDLVEGKVDAFTADGVVVADGYLAAGALEMDAAGLDVIDLVPGDLAVEPALRFLRRAGGKRLRGDPFHAPGGAHEAVLVRPSVTERLGAVAAGPRDRAGMLRLTQQAQRYAPVTADVRVVPGLRAGDRGALDRWRELDEASSFAYPYARLTASFVAIEGLHLLALAAGAAVAPIPGALALAVWSAKPALVFGGRPSSGGLSPAGVGAASLLRLPRSLSAVAATAVAGGGDARSQRVARAQEPRPAVPRAERLFEARRTTCPWCGSDQLAARLDAPDLYQHKPGSFHLDECSACGHVFQNPALSLAGLDYYYDQFYEGSGEALTDTMFSSLGGNDEQRIAAVAQFAEPRSWLDVGTGHGHFCARARLRWPEARVDGCDMSESVEEAQRRGWIGTAYRGVFVDIAGDIPHRYDVVSMHHYLEHTREPRRELTAAIGVLAPGGHLEIEVPDAESPWGRRLGRLWYGWSQPQHQHFVRCDNLVAELRSRGLDVVSVERGPATLSGDLLASVVLGMQTISRSPHLPWLPPVSPS